MNSKVAVRTIMAEKGIGTTEMARVLGKLPQNVNDMLNLSKAAHFTTGKLSELLQVLGYKIVLVPSDVPVQDGWYEIDGSTPTPVSENDPDQK